MGRIIVHLGAHRTATTLLQQTLTENSKMLEQAGLELLAPPKTRRQVFDGLIKRPSLKSEADIQIGTQTAKKLRNRFRKYKNENAPSLFVSEENILGTMRECRDCTKLYPELAARLAPYVEAFAHVDCLVLGIRNTHHWWCSALAYTVGEYADLPTPEELDAVVASPHSWMDVISDVRRCFPDVPLVVREHPYNAISMGPDLASQTGLEPLAQISPVNRISNSAADEDFLQRTLEKRGADTGGLRAIMPGGVFDPFSHDQRKVLTERYKGDIAALEKSTDDQILFYPSRSKLRLAKATQTAPDEPPICLLHIGKTGGSFLRSVLRAGDNLPVNLNVLKHNETLESTRRRFGTDRQLAFVIREPKARFVSAFNSRMRQGRPTYNSQWSVSEAVAFQWFKDANSLAEALGSNEERMRSAAYFAMENIQHLRMNYQYFLTSVEALKREKNNIRCCVDLTELDAKLPVVLAALGVESIRQTSDKKRHSAPIAHERLSELAVRHLSNYWAKELEIYKYCQENFLIP